MWAKTAKIDVSGQIWEERGRPGCKTNPPQDGRNPERALFFADGRKESPLPIEDLERK
jgi:hypothetical protein